MKEHTEEQIVTQVFSLILNTPRSIEEITKRIYRNQSAKNITRIYQTIEIMMKRGIVIPIFKNRLLQFKIDLESLGLKKIK